jgi:pyruvate dehydrogenase phosphatase
VQGWQATGEFHPQENSLRIASPSSIVSEKDDTLLDQKTGCLSWKAQKEHFVVEDDHCGVHLVKNALGGSRRGLFETATSLRPPLPEKIRGDIFVMVTFFDDGVTVRT